MVALLLWMGCWQPLAAGPDDPIEVIVLKHRLPVEIVPVIRPLLASDDALTATGNQLIVRTDSRTLAQIKSLLPTLDTPARNLLITVRNVDASAVTSQGYSVSAQAKAGNAKIIVGTPGTDKINVKGKRNTFSTDQHTTQRLQVIEGRAAFIQTGQTVPYRQRRITAHPHGLVVQSETAPRDVTSGFYVLARTNGQTVTLEITPQSQSLNTRDGTIGVRRAATHVSGRLGEWITIAGSDQKISSDSTGVIYSTRRNANDDRLIQVKVEPAN